MEPPLEYLLQHYLTYVPNPSDDSDFEELTYKSAERIDISILNNQTEAAIEKIDIENERKRKSEEYLRISINLSRSIFNLPGIEFTKYTHKTIDFKLKPIEFRDFPGIIIKDFICDRTYRIILKYRSLYGRWILKYNHIPCKDEVIGIFKSNVYDPDLEDVIFSIYDILRKHTKKLALERHKRKEAFLSGEDVILTEDEEKLFLTETEIKTKRMKEKQIWRRMLLPEKLQIRKIKKGTMWKKKLGNIQQLSDDLLPNKSGTSNTTSESGSDDEENVEKFFI